MQKEVREVEENGAVSQTVVTEATRPETKEMGDAGQILPPQAKERTKLNAKQTNTDQKLQPRGTECTEVADTPERGTEAAVKVTQERPPPPKPRRGIQAGGEKSASPEAPPQPRPRTVSASRPSPLPNPLSQTRELPHAPPARPGVDVPGTSLTESAAGKASKPPPPASPSGLPPLKQEPTAPVTAEAPKAKRRSQLEPVEGKGSTDVGNPSVTQAPTPSPRTTAGEEGSEVQVEVVKQPQRKPEKPPPPKLPRGGQTGPHQTSASTTQDGGKKSSLPRKPPPPRQVSERGTVNVADDRPDVQPDSSIGVAASQRKSTQPSQTPPPRQPSTTQSGRQDVRVDDGEGAVNPPVARRRNTAENLTEIDRKGDPTTRPSASEKEEDGEEKAPQAAKRQPKRRTPMVIRPAHDEVTSESKSSATTEPTVTVDGSPEPAEPSAGHQEEKQLLSEESITTENASLDSTKETDTSTVEGSQNALQEEASESSNSKEGAGDRETVQLPTIAEQSVPQPEASSGNTTVMEKTEESAGW